VTFFVEQIRRIRDRKFQIFAIQGQHDRALPSWTKVTPGVVNLDAHSEKTNKGRHYVQGCEAKITGIENQPAEVLKDTLAGLIDDIDILVLHQAMKGAFGIEEICDFEKEWLPDNISLVLIGDIHKPICTQHGDTKILYPGSTHMRAIDETPDKSFIVIKTHPPVAGIEIDWEWEDDNKHAYPHVRIPLETRPFQRHLISSEQSLDEAVEKILSCKGKEVRSEISRPMIVADYYTDVPNAMARLEDACEQVNAFFMRRPRTPESVFIDRDGAAVEEDLSNVSLETCLSDVVNPSLNPELHSFLLSLLKSLAPKEEIERHKKEILHVGDHARAG
jgi:DNA repair exonuclease SbcCD nuclease subunit